MFPVCPVCRTCNGLLALNTKCRSIAPLHRREICRCIQYTYKAGCIVLASLCHACAMLVSHMCHACVARNFLRPFWSSCEALENFKLQWLVPVWMSCPSSCLCDGEGKTKTNHSTKLRREWLKHGLAKTLEDQDWYWSQLHQGPSMNMVPRW